MHHRHAGQQLAAHRSHSSQFLHRKDSLIDPPLQSSIHHGKEAWLPIVPTESLFVCLVLRTVISWLSSYPFGPLCSHCLPWMSGIIQASRIFHHMLTTAVGSVVFPNICRQQLCIISQRFEYACIDNLLLQCLSRNPIMLVSKKCYKTHEHVQNCLLLAHLLSSTLY